MRLISSLLCKDTAVARDKLIDRRPQLITVDFSRQILPGSCEYALCYFIDHEMELAEFEHRCRNDAGGAPAYAPALVLKIILLAYARGLVSARARESACPQHGLFLAVCGGATPHFTTLAAFVSSGGEALSRLFPQGLRGCDRQGLSGRQLFALDGVKLPGNATKARSGTRKEVQREAKKRDRAVRRMLARHRQEELTHSCEPSLRRREARQGERLQQEAEKSRTWLQAHAEDRRGVRGGIRKSHRTDTESAKLATGKGVSQGVTGGAVVDEQYQIIVDAQAPGGGQEQELRVPVGEAVPALRAEAPVSTAAAGDQSEDNLQQLAAQGSDASLPDKGYRKRAPRYRGQEQHRGNPAPLYHKGAAPANPRLCCSQDFPPAGDRSPWVCPAGERLYRTGHPRDLRGCVALKFTGRKTACGRCPLRERCLRSPDKTPVRQVVVGLGPTAGQPATYPARLKGKLESPTGKEGITRRFATVAPVLGNRRHNKRLSRFTLRGRPKVEGQGKRYCLGHNIEKLAHLGYAK